MKRANYRRKPQPKASAPRTRLWLERLEDRTLLSTADIVAENSNTGTASGIWDVAGNYATIGDYNLQTGLPNIEGFVTDISTDISTNNPNRTVYFKINDKVGQPYHLDIYRLGYYGGTGARKIATVQPYSNWQDSQAAPVPFT